MKGTLYNADNEPILCSCNNPATGAVYGINSFIYWCREIGFVSQKPSFHCTVL
jgi:hypothetical protein